MRRRSVPPVRGAHPRWRPGGIALGRALLGGVVLARLVGACDLVAPVSAPREGLTCVGDSSCDAGLSCVEGLCHFPCVIDGDCPGSGRACVNGACFVTTNAVCSPSSCTQPGPCQQADGANCVDGRCVYVPRAVNEACDDGNRCTTGDLCDGNGGCVGTPRLCVTPPPNECSADDTTLHAVASLGVCIASTGDCRYEAVETPCPNCRATCLRPCFDGDCCNTADDCPAYYGGAALCRDWTTATDCQGSRREIECVNHACGTAVVPNDTGCGGLVYACAGGFAPWACSATVAQPKPACASTCTGNADCAVGYSCANGACGLLAGTGASCTGSGQGTCALGQKCDNGVCCAVEGGTCCLDSKSCSSGLACNTATFACSTTCNDNSGERCSDPAATYCHSNACVPKTAMGQPCLVNEQCGTQICVGGICCTTACDGACEACSLSRNGQADGQCLPVLSGLSDTAPTNLCTATGVGCERFSVMTGVVAGSCACDGSASGALACRLAAGQLCTAALQCASDVCECADAACATRRCSARPCGTCEYTLDGHVCLPALGSPLPIKDGTECTGAYSCFLGHCGLDNGQPCAAGGGATQCASGSCVDGFCCDSACNGTCQRCDATNGTPGQCHVAAAGTDPDDECASTGTNCHTNTCSGAAAACEPKASGVRCGRCLSCDGAGACVGNSTAHADCGLCKKCLDGVCVAQTGAEDLKNECSPASGCGTGNCSGSGACTYFPKTTWCATCTYCDGAGFCSKYVALGSPDSASGCAEVGVCGNQACNGSGQCADFFKVGKVCSGSDVLCDQCSGGALGCSAPPTPGICP